MPAVMQSALKAVFGETGAILDLCVDSRRRLWSLQAPCKVKARPARLRLPGGASGGEVLARGASCQCLKSMALCEGLFLP